MELPIFSRRSFFPFSNNMFFFFFIAVVFLGRCIHSRNFLILLPRSELVSATRGQTRSGRSTSAIHKYDELRRPLLCAVVRFGI